MTNVKSSACKYVKADDIILWYRMPNLAFISNQMQIISSHLTEDDWIYYKMANAAALMTYLCVHVKRRCVINILRFPFYLEFDLDYYNFKIQYLAFLNYWLWIVNIIIFLKAPYFAFFYFKDVNKTNSGASQSLCDLVL